MLRFGESYGTKLDDIRFYNRAITVEEIAELYQLPSSCSANGIETDFNVSKETKQINSYYDLFGQEIKTLENYSGILFILYSDGSYQKTFK